MPWTIVYWQLFFIGWLCVHSCPFKIFPNSPNFYEEISNGNGYVAKIPPKKSKTHVNSHLHRTKSQNKEKTQQHPPAKLTWNPKIKIKKDDDVIFRGGWIFHDFHGSILISGEVFAWYSHQNSRWSQSLRPSKDEAENQHPDGGERNIHALGGRRNHSLFFRFCYFGMMNRIDFCI